MTIQQKQLLQSIKTKGFYEQEKQYLFPALYGNKAVTKNTVGFYKRFNNSLKKLDKTIL